MDTGQPESMGAPQPERSGLTVDDAVANAESGSQVEGVHTPSGEAASGESRVEQMTEVPGVTEPRVDGSKSGQEPPPPGPSPADVGSGGAQRIVGAGISDRKSAGEEAPDGPPFADGSSGAAQEQ